MKATDLQTLENRFAVISHVLGSRCAQYEPTCMTCIAWAMSDEIERLQEEDRQWDKHSLVQIIKDRDAERTKRQQAEYERDCLVEGIARLQRDLSQLRDDAAETVQFWGDYASDYFKEKHDLALDVKRLKSFALDVSCDCEPGAPASECSGGTKDRDCTCECHTVPRRAE